MSDVSTACMIAGVAAAFCAAGPMAMVMDVNWKWPSRRITTIMLVHLATSWLWMPWLCYGVYTIGCWTKNGIDYQERPPSVIPLRQKTIDLNDEAPEGP